MSIEETRLMEILGDFERKIRLQISDLQMSVDNSMTILNHRVKKLEDWQSQSEKEGMMLLKRLDEMYELFDKRIQALEGREQTQ